MSSLYRKASTIRSFIIELVLVSALLILLSSAHGQTLQFQVAGNAYIGEGYFGSAAWNSASPYGSKFKYSSAWPDGPSELGECLAGQQCDINLPIRFFDIPDPGYTWACLKGTCSQYLGGSVTVSTFSFITPSRPDWGETYVSGVVSVNGSVSAAYSNNQGVSWELWNASFYGRGKETVKLWAYGDGRFLILYAEANYKGMGSATSEVAEIERPLPVPSGIAYNDGSLFMSQAGAFGSISQLSLPAGAVLNTFLTPSANGFDGRSTPSDIAFGDHHLFMSDVGIPGSGAVYDFDPLGTTIYNHFAVPFRGGALAFDGKRLFVGDLDSGQVSVRSRSGSPISSFRLPFSAAGMVFDEQRNWLWVISQTDPEQIWQFTTKGTQIGFCGGPWSPGLDGVGGITVNTPGRLYIAEMGKFYMDSWLGYWLGVISSVEPGSLGCTPALPLTIKLVINPGLPAKLIDPKNGGTISAAVLTTNKFDAATIDPTTVRFGDTGEEATPLNWVLEDVNADGRADLLLQFNIQDTGITCWTSVTSVSGQTLSQRAVRGSHSIRTKACGT